MLAEPDPVLLEKLKLFEKSYLKRAAVMLFHDDPEVVVTGAYVKIGYFRTDSDLLYHDEIHGDLFSQVEKTLDLLLTKYLRAGISYEGLQRLETFPIPETALREAIINAIAHKDYASSIPIQISVYHDKLMIWNAGQLPHDWTIDRLTAKHASAPFNPDIANAFFRVAYLESWGRGIDLIRNACRTHGSPTPLFRWENGLWVEFPFPKEIPENGGRNDSDMAAKVAVKMAVKVAVKMHEQILETLKSNPRQTKADVAAAIGKSLRTVERACAKLIKEGRIRYIGSPKAGHWEVLTSLETSLETGLETSLETTQKTPDRTRKSVREGSTAFRADSTGLPVDSTCLPFDSTGLKAKLQSLYPAGLPKKLSKPQFARVVLALCAVKPLTLAILAEMLVRSPTFLQETHLRPLCRSGLIEMTIPDKPNSPRQQYRLTVKGRAILRQRKPS